MIEHEINFSAIFTATDEAVIGAIATLSDYGMRIPDDVTIASIDNLEISSMMRPALTTVDIPKRMLAKFALQVLQNQKDYEMDSPVSMVVPTKLIVRDSCDSQQNFVLNT